MKAGQIQKMTIAGLVLLPCMVFVLICIPFIILGEAAIAMSGKVMRFGDSIDVWAKEGKQDAR